MRTSISPTGTFCYGIHKPSYRVDNLRSETKIDKLGSDQDEKDVLNAVNYPDEAIEVTGADWIYEIANPFPFRGSTFIGKTWADRNAQDPDKIKLPPRPEVSLSHFFETNNISTELIPTLPRPLLLSLATTSTDADDLVQLAHISCSFDSNSSGIVNGLNYTRKKDGAFRAVIHDHDLFEAVANNPALPDHYKITMVIKPGAQGSSEIVGDFRDGDKTHIYEYLRKNSYIGGGHYAANMADDAIRYSVETLLTEDMTGLRHLYYQRTYTRIASLLGIPFDKKILSTETLELLRQEICSRLTDTDIALKATLWGWNFGFDYAPSGYRLHASHQQIHQQYAMVPNGIEQHTDGFSASSGTHLPFSSGDMIEEIIAEYRNLYGQDFFQDYVTAITCNRRMDGRHDRDANLVVWQDEQAMLFVPKAQTSQWELQLMTKPVTGKTWPGNIVETDSKTRHSIDLGILKAQQALAGRGAQMVTSIEYSKRFDSTETTQPLIYSFMPKIPESPGAFSETQLRYINGHYPEDFASVCRQSLCE